jgi:ribonuclease-3
MTLFDKFGYAFKSTDILRQALTHKSYHNENPTKTAGHNERLEFLGDAVIDLSLSTDLMNRFPELSEGELSKIRASLVNENTLAELSRELGVDEFLLLGKGEHQTGGAAKPRLLASAFEALLGALYQDADFATADGIIRKIFAARIESLDMSIHFKSDYKTRLQEKLQGMLKQIPQYELESEQGPDHDKIFYVNIKVDDRVVARGSGRSKKQAEQEAAREALEILI